MDVTVCATCSQPSPAGTESEGEQRFYVIRENLQAFARHRIPDSRRRVLGTRSYKFVFPGFGTRAPLHVYEFRRVPATHHASSRLQIPRSRCAVVRATR